MPPAVWASGAVAAALATALLFPPAVDAAFPGRDGLIAFTRFVGSRPGQIYLVRPNGHGLRQLTHRRRGAGAAAWSPDGRRIAFSGTARRGGVHVFVKRIGGGVRQVTHGPGTGGLIAYTWAPGLGGDDVRVVRADGTADAPITDDLGVPDGGPAWAPSGTRMAIARLGRIWTVAPDGSGLRRVTDGPANAGDLDPSWQPR
jgi:Tol biopolymer transport system component